ncbi:ATP-dependent nuclease [Curtobacterium sp. UNCCL17]|uniref:ATP-dependent nuclease n=1 Tax=Curtobacterium sp. UNCCL17 TaxID=1449051 RepID=UPI0018CC3A18|nr:AAA family ATPase [Curtobacterium sp. UNCCL17]
MRIQRVTFSKFKQFKNGSIDFQPGLTIVAGGNNAGKSSLLQGLAVWEFCKVATIAQRGKSGLLEERESSQGFGLGDDEFSPINIPSLKHLWSNLRSQKDEDEADGYTLAITLFWQDSIGAELKLGFSLALANDRLFIKVATSSLAVDSEIPVIAYLPPFAGISAKEERIRGAARRRRIGEGLAGAVLRNLLLDMRDNNLALRDKLRGTKTKISDTDLRSLRESDPWELLQQAMRETFASEIVLRDFDEEYHTYIQANVDKGTVSGYKLTRYPKFNPRDLMVEGSGFLQWLSVYTLATSPEANVLLFDEPDAHLHAALQMQLVTRLEGLAEQLGKQVLLATHSPEIIRETPLAKILEVKSGGKGRYLTTEQQKVGMMMGIGSTYAPRLDKIRSEQKVLFHEGTSDLSALREIARVLSKEWPSYPTWQTTQSHKERRLIWRALRAEYGQIEAISLRDRDEDSVKTVGEKLEDKADKHSEGDFRSRKWRRRYLESYLIVPSAIARVTGKSEQAVKAILADEFSLSIGKSYYRSNVPAPLLDVRGKEILEHFNLNAFDVSKRLEPDEVCEDLALFVQEVADWS